MWSVTDRQWHTVKGVVDQNFENVQNLISSAGNITPGNT